MPHEINPGGVQLDFAGQRFAIVVSTYHEMITGKLLDGATRTLHEQGVDDAAIDVARVPGAWELALGTRTLIATRRYAGLVALGAVIRGETTHDQHINRFVSQSIGQLSLEYGVPVGFGLLTCQNFQQAHERAGGKMGNKGCEAADAMLQMVHLANQVEPQ